jgi:hypothetical protein
MESECMDVQEDAPEISRDNCIGRWDSVYGDVRLQFTANRVLAGGTAKYHDRL